MEEDFVKKSIIKWLEKYCWEISKKITEHIHHVDIKAHHKNGCQYLIECKGETKNQYGDFHEGLGQILSRMIHKIDTSDTNYYGLGLPDNSTYRDLVHNKIPNLVRKKLKLRILFVNENGEVREIKSSEKMV